LPFLWKLRLLWNKIVSQIAPFDLRVREALRAILASEIPAWHKRKYAPVIWTKLSVVRCMLPPPSRSIACLVFPRADVQPFRRFAMVDLDVECWPRSEREMSAMSILSKSSLCPNCANAATHRARRRGLLEHILHVVFFVSPLRCEVCDERYFRVRFLTAPSAHKHHHAA
jgi:hypothetical protein